MAQMTVLRRRMIDDMTGSQPLASNPAILRPAGGAGAGAATRFVADSALEGTGFELSVPGRERLKPPGDGTGKEATQ